MAKRRVILQLIVIVGLAAAALALPTDKGGSRRADGGGETATTSSTESSERDSHEEDVRDAKPETNKDSQAEHSSITEVELMTGDEADDSLEADDEEVEDDPRGEGQHFFPSFAPLFGGDGPAHPRAHLFHEQPRGFTDNYRSIYPSEETERVLGSGNFGVLRGGTYYAGSRDEDEEEADYYRNNGHGRPPYFGGNPRPAYRQGGDFFAGFRDFADITTPPKSAYSQYYVVYANKNSTSSPASPGSPPKNILERLRLLDAAAQDDKESKRKQKLAEYKDRWDSVEARKKNKSPKDLSEPLLALS